MRPHPPNPESERAGEPAGEAARRGQWWATPLIVLGGVATVVWLAAAALTGVLVLVWWLA